MLSLCKLGKSCGSDGVPYELLQIIMQTDLKFEFAVARYLTKAEACREAELLLEITTHSKVELRMGVFCRDFC